MKTKIYSALLGLAVVFGIIACNLDPKVYSSMTDSNFPETADDANALLTGLYANIKNNSGGLNDSGVNGGWGWPIWCLNASCWWGFNEATTDELYQREATDVRNFDWGSAWDTMSTYRIIKNITRATSLLGVLDKNTTIPTADKKKMAAETKCIRAYIMFTLYDLYGPVQFDVDPNALTNIQYRERPTKEEYFNQMVKDLTEAIPDLPGITQGTSDWGRVNKGLANMLLMKLYMNAHQWTKALPYAEAVVKLGYKLEPNYFTPFTEEQSMENVWAIPSGSQGDNEFFYYTIPSNCSYVCGMDVAPYWGVVTMPWEFYETFTANDVRKKGIGDHYTGPDGTEYTRNGVHQGNLQYGAIVTKYMLPKERTSSGNLHQCCFRYADVILSLAEIENNLHGPTDKALSYLKMITDRAHTTNTIPSDIQESKEKFNQFLLAERGRELYFEGWRREDLIRFGEFIKNAQARGKHAKEYMEIMPIPPQVITESGDIVKNNPGYE